MGSMRPVTSVFALIVLVTAVASQHGHDHGGVDVFSQVLAKLNVTQAERLPFAATEKFVDAIFHRFTCSGNGTCLEAVCLETDGLFTLLGANQTVGLDEEQFHELTSVVLYYALHLSNHCRSTVDLTATNLTQIHEALRSKFDDENTGTISEEGIDHVLEALKGSLSHDHDHDHAHGEEAHEDHADEVLVIEEKCLSPDGLLYQIGAEDGANVSRLEDVALFLVYHLYEESTIKEKCRLLPKKKYFLDELFEMYHAVNGTITKTEFKEMLEALNLTTSAAPPAGDSGHAHGHAHRRKRASGEDVTLTRSKRAAATEPGHSHGGEAAWNKTCYSAEQLMAVVGAESGLKEAEFRDLCPALLYQQVTGACVPPPSAAASTGLQPSVVEQWAYSMVAVFVISLCALAGGLMSCCKTARPLLYSGVVNFFQGLAVGTLLTDAALHLIPEALGLHSHGGEAASTEVVHAHHTDAVVLEETSQKMLLFVSFLFAMYLFETLMNNFCCVGHGHSHSTDNQKYELHETANGHSPSDMDTKMFEKPHSRRGVLAPVVLMVLLGDAIHNFADGLAIGAAFHASTATGLATSIAVFCHELPHELGDLAVMLMAGMRMKTALLLNFLSALTAFGGAAISLGLLSGLPEAQPWIFIVAAAIFTYIALAAIVPQLNVPQEAMGKTAQFLCVASGIIVGIIIMVVLVLFEEKIGSLQI